MTSANRRMLAQVIEALEALPPAPATDIALALAHRARDEYPQIDSDSATGWTPLGSKMLPAPIVALETMSAPRAVT